MELKDGTLLQGGKYKIEKKLGQGSFGITYLATAKFSTDSGLGKMDVVAKVCIKEFFMSDVNSRKEDGSTIEGSAGTVFTNYRRKFRKEAENLSKLDHLNIVRVYDVFDENDTTYYAMEYVDGENLDDYIKTYNPLNEEDTVSIVLKICQALKFMHERQMLHLDLKPKNIMRSKEGKICLIDFGLSKQFLGNGEPESSTTIGLGTPGYAPLEQAKFIKNGLFPATLDIYALGATMYKLLTGTQPPEASDILNEGFPREQFDRIGRSEILIGVVEKCMSPMKKDRYQCLQEIIDILPNKENCEHECSEIQFNSSETTLINIPRQKEPKESDSKSSLKESSEYGVKRLNDPTVKASTPWYQRNILYRLSYSVCYVWLSVNFLFNNRNFHSFFWNSSNISDSGLNPINPISVSSSGVYIRMSFVNTIHNALADDWSSGATILTCYSAILLMTIGCVLLAVPCWRKHYRKIIPILGAICCTISYFLCLNFAAEFDSTMIFIPLILCIVSIFTLHRQKWS